MRFYDASVGLPWGFHDAFMGLLWYFHGVSMVNHGASAKVCALPWCLDGGACVFLAL